MPRKKRITKYPYPTKREIRKLKQRDLEDLRNCMNSACSSINGIRTILPRGVFTKEIQRTTRLRQVILNELKHREKEKQRKLREKTLAKKKKIKYKLEVYAKVERIGVRKATKILHAEGFRRGKKFKACGKFFLIHTRSILGTFSYKDVIGNEYVAFRKDLSNDRQLIGVL